MTQSRIFLLLALALFGFGPLAMAQDGDPTNRVKVSLGPKIGMNFSKLDGESWESGYQTNLLGGVWISVHGERFGIQVEGLFSQTTYTTGQDFDEIYKQYLEAGKDSLQNGMFRLNYFNIPVLAQIKLINRIWLQVGPQYSGLVSVKDVDNFVKDAESLFKSGTISLVTGLHIDLTRHLNIGGRYVIGLSDVENTGMESWKQRDIQVHLGYRF